MLNHLKSGFDMIRKIVMHPLAPLTVGSILMITATSMLTFVCGLIVFAVGLTDIVTAKR